MITDVITFPLMWVSHKLYYDLHDFCGITRKQLMVALWFCTFLDPAVDLAHTTSLWKLTSKLLIALILEIVWTIVIIWYEKFALTTSTGAKQVEPPSVIESIFFLWNAVFWLAELCLSLGGLSGHYIQWVPPSLVFFTLIRGVQCIPEDDNGLPFVQRQLSKLRSLVPSLNTSI